MGAARGGSWRRRLVIVTELTKRIETLECITRSSGNTPEVSVRHPLLAPALFTVALLAAACAPVPAEPVPTVDPVEASPGHALLNGSVVVVAQPVVPPPPAGEPEPDLVAHLDDALRHHGADALRVPLAERDGGWTVDLTGAPAVPLDELLTALPDAVWVFDLQAAPGAVASLADALRAHHAWERVAFTGPDEVLERLRDRAPHAVTALSDAELLALHWIDDAGRGSWRPAGQLLLAPWDGGRGVLDAETVTRAQALGLAVHAEVGADEAAAVDQLVDLGVDGVHTPEPEQVRAVLDR